MSEVIWLSKEERERFVAYCRQEARSHDGLARQMATMPSPMTEQLAELYKSLAATFAMVATQLEREEEQ